MIKNPRERNVETFATVAGSSHIDGCIAGTNIFGTSDANTKFVKRSSARPAARRAMRSAVAGAIKKKLADSAREICGTVWTLSHT
jgi:hypothetical protein